MRLEPSSRGHVVPWWTCFNPTLVRLERSAAPGACAYSPCFNPTLVRLEPRRVAPARRGRCGFNPTLVRLERAVRTHGGGQRLPSFNPTLVRLEHDGSEAYVNDLVVSIPLWCDWNGPNNATQKVILQKVSIPLWCDWNDAL